MSGLGIVAIGGLIGAVISATIAQWNYTKALGSSGFFFSRWITFRLDLGWKDSGIAEVARDLIDLRVRAQQLEEELIQLQKEQLRRVKNIADVKKVGKRILGLGGKVHSYVPLPSKRFFNFLGRRGRKTDEAAQDDGEDEGDDHDADLDDEITRRREAIKAELHHIRDEEDDLRVYEGRQ